METSEYMEVMLPDGYQWVLLTTTLIAFECLMIGCCFPGRARSRHFKMDFMKKFYSIHGLDSEGRANGG